MLAHACAVSAYGGHGTKLGRILVLLLRPRIVGAALAAALAGMACLGAQDAATPAGGGGGPGISQDQVLFGQSAALRGPSKDLGREMRLGIQAAFHEVNQSGGVHGRQLKLETMNDSYRPDLAFHTAQRLIEKAEVFALIGAVGTPTSRVASPRAYAAGVPFLAPFTGAEFLRDPALNNVVNLRASYYDETEEMIARLTEDLGVTRVAVFHQDDSFGKDGLEGVRLALKRRRLAPVGSWSYQRELGVDRRAASSIVHANPQAVIMIGAHDPVAATVEFVRREIDPVFMTVSFAGGQALTKALEEAGDGVYVTQVVPFPTDASIPVVTRYHAALSRFNPKAQPGFVSLEGYLAGRLAIFGLDACGRQLSRMLHERPAYRRDDRHRRISARIRPQRQPGVRHGVPDRNRRGRKVPSGRHARKREPTPPPKPRGNDRTQPPQERHGTLVDQHP